jgi:hypothetical protein
MIGKQRDTKYPTAMSELPTVQSVFVTTVNFSSGIIGKTRDEENFVSPLCKFGS